MDPRTPQEVFAEFVNSVILWFANRYECECMPVWKDGRSARRVRRWIAGLPYGEINLRFYDAICAAKRVRLGLA